MIPQTLHNAVLKTLYYLLIAWLVIRVIGSFFAIIEILLYPEQVIWKPDYLLWGSIYLATLTEQLILDCIIGGTSMLLLGTVSLSKMKITYKILLLVLFCISDAILIISSYR